MLHTGIDMIRLGCKHRIRRLIILSMVGKPSEEEIDQIKKLKPQVHDHIHPLYGVPSIRTKETIV